MNLCFSNVRQGRINDFYVFVQGMKVADLIEKFIEVE